MTELHELPGYLIRRLQQLAVAVFVTEVGNAGFDLTPVQFAALSVVGDFPGIDQATLASRIAYDRATIGGVTDRLCDKGLVVRQVNPQDRRARLLELTSEGQRILMLITPLVHDVQENILAGLSPSERTAFMEMLRKLTNTTRSDSVSRLEA